MSKTYILDTDICSYIIRENPKTVIDKFWEHKNDDFYITSITLAELMYGVAHKGSAKIAKQVEVFLSRMMIIDFNDTAAEEYAKIRYTLEKTGNTIGNMDMLIAACALACDGTLITNNKKHFLKIPNLKIEHWL
ncbi:type II toxin-antitoxin system tRNA(fMet)-specific endonuclease VapC [Endomicrobium proavitum]|uniref:Ribonuclease VapC n=1 Tax=Endomicrobium proavitum TaxID=1408281 RepID=A0A0G3WHR3_9BACT|nr:type II toxin-antitoxin system VapC family toxin [Endomicrobium proavitum]AKL97868.1 Ribonuclease VapC [Endomicrobium proavitum]